MFICTPLLDPSRPYNRDAILTSALDGYLLIFTDVSGMQWQPCWRKQRGRLENLEAVIFETAIFPRGDFLLSRRRAITRHAI